MNIEVIKQANSIYAEFVDMPSAEAIIKLDTLEIEPDVRNLVAQLIKNAEQPSQYFNDMVGAVFDQQTTFTSSWQTGDTLGDYILSEPIGSGGMSQVFRATRNKSEVQKPVAIKIFAPLNNSVKLAARFLAEQQILSELSHPNIVTLHHGGSSDDGNPYIVMELVENAQAINEYSANHLLSAKNKMQLILNAAQAVEHAHNNLVIHRDIKPSNIIIDDHGQLKVVDFGIAKLIEQDQTNDQHTLLAMTPSYAAPEQILGTQITVKTDVFSLAAVALNLITGDLPFPENRLLKACQTDDEYVQNTLKKLTINQDLKNILNQALQQDANRRYANMHAFAKDIEAWMKRRPVSATADSMVYRLKKFAQRRQALFSSLFVLLLTLLIGLTVLSWQFNQTRIEALKAQAVKQFMLNAFSVTDPDVAVGIDISAKDLLTVAADNLDENKNIDPEIKFELYQSLGLAYSKLGYLPRAIELIKQSLSIKPHDSGSLAYLSQILFKAGKQQELTELLAQINETDFSSPTDQARLLRTKANRLAEGGDYDAALALIEQISHLEVSHQESLFNQSLEAKIYYLMGQSPKSIEIIHAAIGKADLKPTHTLILGMQMDLVHYYDRVGNYAEALKLVTHVIKQYRKILGNKHPNLGLALNELSVFHQLNGNLDLAQEAAIESKNLFMELYGNVNPGLSQAYSNLGMLAYLNKDADAAIDNFNKSIEILRAVYSNDHPETLVAVANFAIILMRLERAEEAKPLLEHVYQVESKTLGPAHRSTLFTQQSLTLTQATTGELKSAILSAEENFKTAKANFDHQLPVVTNSQSVLGRVYLKAGRYQDALQLFLPLEKNRADGGEVRYFRFTQNIARAYAGMADFPQAESYWLKSIEGMNQIYTDQHINSIETELKYVKLLKHQGKEKLVKQRLKSINERVRLARINDPEVLNELKHLNHN